MPLPYNHINKDYLGAIPCIKVIFSYKYHIHNRYTKTATTIQRKYFIKVQNTSNKDVGLKVLPTKLDPILRMDVMS